MHDARAADLYWRFAGIDTRPGAPPADEQRAQQRRERRQKFYEKMGMRVPPDFPEHELAARPILRSSLGRRAPTVLDKSGARMFELGMIRLIAGGL
jgi:hypothetical protein